MAETFANLRSILEQAQRDVQYEPNDAERVVRRLIDRPGLDGFQWMVWWVASSGFFTTSYTLFSINVIGTAIQYVYPNCDPNVSKQSQQSQQLSLTLPTLFGTAVGMILFGRLADHYGRKAIYGVELVVVIFGTVGMTTATSGYGDVMDIYGWIGFWRFFLGIGLGAEIIIMAAEWSSTRVRARMLAAVFLMQSIGQLAAYGVGLLVLVLVRINRGMDPNESDPSVARPVIDIFWRVTIAIGVAPALISILLRRLLPETALWYVAKGLFGPAGRALRVLYPHHRNSLRIAPAQLPPQHGIDDDEEEEEEEDQTWKQKLVNYLYEMHSYLANNDRWRALLGIMIVWFLFDVAFFGLAFDSPAIINEIWLSSNVNTSVNTACDLSWRTDPDIPNISIYEMLKQNTIRDMITISTGTVVGSVFALIVIDYIPRVSWMACWFLGLSGIFLINGGTFYVAYESNRYALTVTLYVLAQVMFNLGPNTITFMLPAELFDTRYRGTFYGLAAASGKLGAIVIRIIISLTSVSVYGTRFAALLLGLSPAMLLGALITWVWIPEVQMPHVEIDSGDARRQSYRQRLIKPNRTLEDIARNPSEGQHIGLRRNLYLVGNVLTTRLGLFRRIVREDAPGEAEMENGQVEMNDLRQGGAQRDDQEAAGAA